MSDLHLAEDTKHNQEVVLKALYADLAGLRNSGTTIDAIIFSGDLVGKGSFSSHIDSWVVDNVFSQLLAASGVPSDRIFLVPGNHDMQLASRDSFLLPVFDALDSRDSVNSFIQDSDTRQFLWGHLEAFNTLRSRLEKAAPLVNNVLFRAFRFEKDGFTVGIGCLNSAWKASGRPKDADYGHLIVGERQAELVGSAIQSCDLKIAVTHHPLSWLATFDNIHVHRALLAHFDALFHGHNHEMDASRSALLQRDLFTSNAGCLYQSRDYFNGYSLIDYDPTTKEWSVSVREYFEQRRCFDICPRFAANGKASFPLSRAGPTESPTTKLPTEQYLTAVSGKLDSMLLTGNISEVAPRHLNSIFVEPVLGKTSERKLASSGDSDGGDDFYRLRDLMNARSPRSSPLFAG